MIPLVARALRGRPIRTLLAVAGIATSALLVVILSGAFRGVRTAMSAYAGQQSIDLWIAPPGADNLIRGSFAAQLGLDLVDSLRASPGIARADPLLKGFLAVRPLDSTDPDRTATLLAIGYQTPDGLGGPPSFAEGLAPKGRREIALDRAAAFRIGVNVGDTVVLGRIKVTVSGLTKGTNILATQFLFGDFDAAAAGLGSQREASLIAVQLERGADLSGVVRDLNERFPDLYFYPRDVFVRANEREVIAGFVPMLTLVALLGTGAACVLVGLLVLSVVDERRSEIAVLMALGARPPPVAVGVLAYAAELLGFGIAIGLALAFCLAATLDRVLPTIPLAPTTSDAIAVAALFGLAGIIAALVPVTQIRLVDPLEAFRP